MKTPFTLLLILLFAAAGTFAQTPYMQKIHTFQRNPNSPIPSHTIHKVNTTSRTAGVCETVYMNYSYYDQTVATSKNLNFNGGQGQPLIGDIMTSFVDSAHVGNKTEIAGIFDTLVYVNVDNTLGYFPLAASTIYIDSLVLPLQLNGSISKILNDSIRFDFYSLPPSGNTILAKTIIFTDTANLEQFFPTGPAVPYVQFPVGLQLPQGNAFAIGITYINKDSSSTLNYFYSYADSCGVPTVIIDGTGYQINTAYPSSLGAITQYSLIEGTGTNGTGPFVVTSGDNLSFGFFSLEGAPNYLPANCALEPVQNLLLYPIINVCTNYSVTIAADNNKACPNATVNLTPTVFGTNSPDSDFVYNWGIEGNGTLTGNYTSTDAVVMGTSGDVTVTLTVTDAGNGNAITSDSIVILNAGFSATITNSNNFSIACDSSTILAVAKTGSPVSLQGLTYIWSDGLTTAEITVNNQTTFVKKPYDYAGDYWVTVTNEWSCSATATATLSYDNGVTNNLSFAPQTVTSDLQFYCPAVFVNRSIYYAMPWMSFIDPDNTGSNFLDVANGSAEFPAYYYPLAGNYLVTLIMDSAGCRFSHAEPVHVVSKLPCEVTPLSVSLGANQILCNESHVIIYPTVMSGSQSYSYSWQSTGDSLNCYNCENPHIILTQNSTYTVTVTDGPSDSATSIVHFNVTSIKCVNAGIDEISEPNIFVEASPNPFNTTTNITIQGINEKYDFELYDVTGRMSRRLTSLDTDHFVLNRENLASGIYFYRITTISGKGAFGKLVVE